MVQGLYGDPETRPGLHVVCEVHVVVEGVLHRYVGANPEIPVQRPGNIKAIRRDQRVLHQEHDW